MSPPRRICLPQDPISGDQAALWSARLRRLGVSGAEVWRRVQPVLGATILPGSHRKFLVPVQELARLMGVTVKTARKFTAAEGRVGRDLLASAPRAVWAAMAMVDLVLGPLDDAEGPEGLDEARADPGFMHAVAALKTWHRQIFGQLELPGILEGPPRPDAVLVELEKPLWVSEAGYYHFNGIFPFETWQELEQCLPSTLTGITDTEIEGRIQKLDEAQFRSVMTEGSELYFDFKQYPPAPVLFAPIFCVKAGSLADAIGRIRKQLAGVGKKERAWGTTRFDLMNSPQLTFEIEGKRVTPGWVRSDEGFLSVHWQAALSPHDWIVELAMEHFA